MQSSCLVVPRNMPLYIIAVDSYHFVKFALLYYLVMTSENRCGTFKLFG